MDKTALINKLLEKDADEKIYLQQQGAAVWQIGDGGYACRVFQQGADSRSLFEPLKCVKDELFLESINQYDTIFVDIQAQFVCASER